MSSTRRSAHLGWACRNCDAVVRRRFLVRWAIGMTDLEPRWLCGSCLERLHQDANDYGSTRVWGIDVLEEQIASTTGTSGTASRGRGGA